MDECKPLVTSRSEALPAHAGEHEEGGDQRQGVVAQVEFESNR